jgi:hypothetical protein
MGSMGYPTGVSFPASNLIFRTHIFWLLIQKIDLLELPEIEG